MHREDRFLALIQSGYFAIYALRRLYIYIHIYRHLKTQCWLLLCRTTNCISSRTPPFLDAWKILWIYKSRDHSCPAEHTAAAFGRLPKTSLLGPGKIVLNPSVRFCTSTAGWVSTEPLPHAATGSGSRPGPWHKGHLVPRRLRSSWDGTPLAITASQQKIKEERRLKPWLIL